MRWTLNLVRNSLALGLVALVTACAGSERQPAKPDPTGNNEPPRLVVTITPDRDTININSTRLLSAQVTNLQGVPQNTPVEWSSRAPEVATVSAGLVTAITPGEAEIVARVGQFTDTARIVVRIEGATLQLTPSAAAVYEGDSVKFDAYLVTPDASVQVQNVAWSLSDTTMGQLNQGLLEATQAGLVDVEAAALGFGAKASVAVFPRRVRSISLTPTTGSVPVGGTTQFTATLRDDRGRVITGRDVSWSSSNASVATVSLDGLASAVARGGALISARSEGVIASAAMNVFGAPASNVTISVPNDSLSVGGTLQLAATAFDAAGQPVTGRPMAWQSSIPSVATVNASGLLTALAAGQTTVSVIVDGKVASQLMTVVVPSPTTLNILPGSATLSVGAQVTLRGEVRDQLGKVMTGLTPTWGSSNAAIASVDAAGGVTGVANGSATINAALGGLRATAAVTVTAVAAASVTITPATLTIDPGATLGLTATVKDAAGNVLPNRPVTWTSSAPTVATVSSAGVISGVAQGSTTISATHDGKTGTAVVTVNASTPSPAQTVTVTLGSPTLDVSQTTVATAQVRDASGTLITGRPIAFASSNALVATVNGNGLVTAVSAGTVSISATIDGKTGYAGLTVTPPQNLPVARVVLSAPTTSLRVTASTLVGVKLYDVNNRELTGRPLAWSSSNATRLTISTDGRATGVSSGAATVSATSEGKTGALGFTVFTGEAPAPAPVFAVALTPNASSLNPGQTTQVNAVLTDSIGGVLSGRTITWSSSNTAVATVSQSGLVSAIAAGNAQISANSEGKTGSTTITVVSVPVTATTVTVSLGSTSLQAGQTTQASAVQRDQNGNQVGEPVFIWSSSNTAVATVSSSGLVTAVGIGSATITALAGSGASGNATVTVTAAVPQTVATVSVSISPSSITVGGGATATATAYSSTGAIVNGRPVTWSLASGAGIATVATNGAVTGVAVGSASIRATVDGISGTGSVTVASTPTSGAALPALPQTYLNFSYPAVTGRTILVRAGDNLQTALNSAVRGDEVVLQAGATFRGSFTLPAKSGTPANGWIIVRSEQLAQLPARGTRVTPANAALMPKIVTPDYQPALQTALSASGYWVAGIEIAVDPAFRGEQYGIVALGDGGTYQTQTSHIASDLVLDRVYIHAATNTENKRCVALNSARTVIEDSYLSECHAAGSDAQAIAGWNGPGPFRIVNNTLIGATENVIFGGTDPRVPGLIPSDIEIRRNYIYTPASWKNVWLKKNLLELKNARRVLIEGNVFDGSWAHGQVGFAFMIFSVNQDGRCNWCLVSDVAIQKNIIRNIGAGFNLAGAAPYFPAAANLARVLIEENQLENMNTGAFMGEGRIVQLLANTQDVTVRRNTMTATSHNTFLTLSQSAVVNFTFENNIVSHGDYGAFGDVVGVGKDALRNASGTVVWNNITVVAGSAQPNYPTGTRWATSLSQAQSMGGAVGANSSTVSAATSGVVIP